MPDQHLSNLGDTSNCKAHGPASLRTPKQLSGENPPTNKRDVTALSSGPAAAVSAFEISNRPYAVGTSSTTLEVTRGFPLPAPA